MKTEIKQHYTYIRMLWFLGKLLHSFLCTTYYLLFITYCSTGDKNFEKLSSIEKFKNFNHLSRPKRK